jgi:PAS domain S-box-containing protein
MTSLEECTLPDPGPPTSDLSVEQLGRLIALSPDAIAAFDLDGTVTWASPESNDVFGEAPGASLVGRSIFGWVAPEEVERVERKLRHLVTGRATGDPEVVCLRADGTRFRAEVRTSVVRDGLGHPEGFVAIARSVDVRHYALFEHEMVAAISHLFLEAAALDEVFARLAVLLGERVGFGVVGVALLDAATGEMVRAASEGKSKHLEMPERLPVRDCVTGLVTTSGEAIVELDVSTRCECHFATLKELGVVSFACVPLRGARGVLGALTFASGERRSEVAQLVGVLQTIADYLALEIEHKRSALALARSEAKYRVFLEDFHGIAYRWAPEGPEPSIVEGAIEEITGYPSADFKDGRLRWFDIVHPDDLPRLRQGEEMLAALSGYRLDAEYRIVTRDGTLRLVNDVAQRVDDGGGGVIVQGAIYDVTVQSQAQERLAASEEKLRRVFNSTHDAIIVHDSQGRVLEVNETWLKAFGVTADEALTFPLADYAAPDEKMVGRLPRLWRETLAGRPQFFEWKARRPHDGSLFDVEVYLCAMALDGGQVVLGNVRDVSERKRAERDALEATERLRRTVKGAVSAMGALVETRDPYTAGHERRVTKLAVAIAMEMGTCGQALETIRLAGEVHDIGKVAVPAEILTKPGRLQDTEFAIIKVHPVAGADILAEVEFGAPVADIVRWHHERLDGSGYPDGLKGDAIPLAARVVAVADVVEAMASHRPYRPALGIEAALVEIREGAGRLYDETVVAACERVFDSAFTFEEET